MLKIVSVITLGLLLLGFLIFQTSMRSVTAKLIFLETPNLIPTFWMSQDSSPPTFFRTSPDNFLGDLRFEQMSNVSYASPLVYILVNSSIYGAEKSCIDRYTSDIESEGFNAAMLLVNTTSPVQIRSVLANATSEGLVGCLLVGDIPWAWYEMQNPDPWGTEEFPIDLFYMDLDGVWNDTDSDGKYDLHTGDRGPEIWVGRIKASNMAEDEVSLMQNYFEKNHNYRTGVLSLPNRALIYVDDDWVPDGYEVDDAVSLVYENRTVASEKATTNASDYLSRLGQNWSLVHLMAHGWSGGHEFKVNDTWDGHVYSSDIHSVDPHALFYNLFSCSNARYDQKDYVGGWYIFSETYGIAAVSSTKTGGMWFLSDFYSKFKQEYLGHSYLKWLENRVSEEDIDPSTWYDKKWYYGMSILGDPTLSLRATFDVNGDGKVDMKDVGAVCKAFGSVRGNARWNPFADVDNNNMIDLKDIAITGRNFGKFYSY